MARAIATRDNHDMPFAGGGSPIQVTGLQVVSASTRETFIKHRLLTHRGPAVIVIKR
ncbi:MAG: hypothetical protein QOJ56_2633 [Mycobacterium sp.]|jgi:hypothetical protein|nr:hypothetical protein [Mycobacterium sp.]